MLAQIRQSTGTGQEAPLYTQGRLAFLRVLDLHGVLLKTDAKKMVERGPSLRHACGTFDPDEKLQPTNTRLRKPGLVKLRALILAVMLLVTDDRLHHCGQPELGCGAHLCAEKILRGNVDLPETINLYEETAKVAEQLVAK